MPSKQNAFASLADSSDSEADSDVEEVQMAVVDTDGPTAKRSHSASGGDTYMRIDPLVAANTESLTNMGFDDEEMNACIKVVSALAKNPNLFKLNQLRPLRQALAPLVVLQMQTGGYTTAEGGSTSGKRDRGGNAKQRAKAAARSDSPNARMKELEKEYINQTQLRAIRLAQLEKLNDGQAAQGEGVDSSMGQLVYRVPDGVGSSTVKKSVYRQAQIEAGSSSSDGGGSSSIVIHKGADLGEEDAAKAAAPAVELQNALSCYICRKPFRKLHFFYAQLCPDCAAFNYMKRDEIADMRGKVCIVTGARAKIGFRCALKLLRCGALVIATTRFPVAAAETFLQEPDSADWWSRVHIYGLDFRNISVLEKFCHFVDYTYARLDAIVNNACQTVRRPPAYYAHMMEGERTQWDAMGTQAQAMLAPYRLFLGHLTHSEHPDAAPASAPASASASASAPEPVPAPAPARTKPKGASTAGVTSHSTEAAPAASVDLQVMTAAGGDVLQNRFGVSLPSQLSLSAGSFFSSAEESQLALLASDADHSQDAQNFPQGYTDVNGQQVDLRRENSWTMRLHQVSTSELAEVMAINAMAPALLNARLKMLMERTGSVPGRGPNGAPLSDDDNTKGKGKGKKEEAEWKFVVNVSAMEGKFYRYKTKNHPHTNMAKASLNMMTRTSAADYVASNIFMTAVDTGWINDEKPLELAVKHEANHNFQTPIDEIDAAARVLDPIIGPLVSRASGAPAEPPYGIFLKDYQKCEW